ncbi:hypothetical protein, partial [Mesorhizobium sp. M2A.F.Ca.ET.037.01.1.1]|uniref:hypothetical protein n=1 Tax=Mesorhizobium sp. M2A.F.Ca.ET.037.01.1.1 TaxID=2496748 RepID=UPI001FE1094A
MPRPFEPMAALLVTKGISMKHLNRTATLGALLALFTAMTPALADSVAYVNKGLVGVMAVNRAWL